MNVFHRSVPDRVQNFGLIKTSQSDSHMKWGDKPVVQWTDMVMPFYDRRQTDTMMCFCLPVKRFLFQSSKRFGIYLNFMAYINSHVDMHFLWQRPSKLLKSLLLGSRFLSKNAEASWISLSGSRLFLSVEHLIAFSKTVSFLSQFYLSINAWLHLLFHYNIHD